MANARILIVEDEPLIAMMLEDFLDSLDYDVHATCDSLASALEAIEAGGFDLAILDINLRGESIWPAAEQLRAKGVPFLLASGGHVEDPPGEFASTPMLAKPYTIARVKPLVEEALASA